MSEKEKQIAEKVAEKLNELNEADRSYLMGIADGLAMANARSAAAEEKKGA